MARELNKAADAAERRRLAAVMYASGQLMGFLGEDPDAWFAGEGANGYTAGTIEMLLEQRRAARADRDFARADGIREQLAVAGIVIEDGPDGTTWRRSLEHPI